MARPLICVDPPEARELIRHGRDGLLVRQPSFMQELGNRAQRKVVAGYQLADGLDQTLENYRRLLPLAQGESQRPH